MSESQAPSAAQGEIIGRMKAKIKELSRRLQKKTDSESALAKKVGDLEKADQSGRVKELEAEVRTLKHRGAFDRAAKARGAADEDLDDLFALSGYRAEGDTVDEKALGRLLDEQAAHPSRKKFFARAEGEGGGEGEERPAPTPKAQEPGPDAGRGKRTDSTVYITREQLADPKWALDPRNAELKRTAKVKA